MTRKTALIIDDEPEVSATHAAMLSARGLAVRTAATADEGLAIARGETPDVILLDVTMPERGGLAALIGLRQDQKLRDVPVILVTAAEAHPTPDTQAFLDRFRHYDPDGWIEKPIDPDLLAVVVERLTTRRA